MEMEVAVLNQKIEFLNEELEESRQKEKNVQQSYDNLLKTIQEGNRVPSADEIYSQIQEMHTDYAEKISSLKASYFQEKSEQDHEYRCLELELKKSHTDHEETKQKLERAQQRVSFANGFEENRMAELENKLIEAQVALQWQKENTKNKIERKIAGYKKQVEISREEGRKEVLQVQTDADKTLKEMRQIYQIEKQNFDEKLDDIQKAYDETQYQKLQIEEAIMSRPSITDGRTSLARKSEIIDIIEFHLSRVQNEAENQILGSTMSCARCAHSAQKVAKLTEIITESRDNIEDLYLEKQQVEINLEAAVLQIRKLKLQVDQKNEEMITREDEHERYTEFLEELRSITDENEQKERALVQSDQIIEAYKSDVSMKNLKSFFAGVEADTPEEEEVLRVCLAGTKRRMYQYAGVGCLFTSAISLVNFDRLSAKFKLFGLFAGIAAGSMYGIVSSTQSSLKMFESLGPEYQLGRLAHDELSEWQTDQAKKDN